MFNRHSKPDPERPKPPRYDQTKEAGEDFSSMPLTAVQMKRRTEDYLEKAAHYQLTDLLTSIKLASKQGLFRKHVLINPDLGFAPAGVISVHDRTLTALQDLGYRVEHEYRIDHDACNWNGLDTAPVRKIVPGSYIISWT